MNTVCQLCREVMVYASGVFRCNHCDRTTCVGLSTICGACTMVEEFVPNYPRDDKDNGNGMGVDNLTPDPGGSNGGHAELVGV